jgi:hypothetical protein
MPNPVVLNRRRCSLHFAASVAFPSGGGFSEWWPRPAYQEAAAAQYLNVAGAFSPARLARASSHEYECTTPAGPQQAGFSLPLGRCKRAFTPPLVAAS